MCVGFVHRYDKKPKRRLFELLRFQGFQIDQEEAPDLSGLEREVKRVKRNLWHGNVYRALQLTEDLEFDLEFMAERSAAAKKLHKAVGDFHGYIKANHDFILDYADR